MPLSTLGYEAWIEVDGNRVDEFQVEVGEEGSRVTCWIPCEADKEFTICCSLPVERLSEDSHIMAASLDGDSVTVYRNLVLKHVRAQVSEISRFSGAYNREKGRIRPFQFGPLELTDDDSCLGTMAKRYGEITLTLRLVETHEPSEPEAHLPPNDPKDEYRAHERSKKGLSHCVRYGEERPCQPNTYYRVSGWKSVCTFVFNYRHMDFLSAKGIAPPKATTSNPGRIAGGSRSADDGAVRNSPRMKRKANDIKEEAQDDKVDDPIDDEIHGLKERLAALEAEKAKRPGSGSGSRPLKRVKQEVPSTLIHGETIDLTTDSPPPGGTRSTVKREQHITLVHGEVIDLTL